MGTDYITRWVEWVPGVAQVFADLAAADVPMAIVSDQTLVGATTALKCLGLSADQFASVVISDEINSCKPAAVMFTTALAELGLAPAQALMIGNHYLRDVQGAYEVGMPALWFRWNEQYPHAEDTGLADYIATDATSLRAALPGWRAGPGELKTTAGSAARPDLAGHLSDAVDASASKPPDHSCWASGASNALDNTRPPTGVRAMWRPVPVGRLPSRPATSLGSEQRSQESDTRTPRWRPTGCVCRHARSVRRDRPARRPHASHQP